MNSTHTPNADSESPQSTAPDPSRQLRPRREGYSYAGLLIALVLTWLSLTPSLLPRGPLFQGVVTGAAAAMGYGLGVLAAAIARWVVRRHAEPRARSWHWWALAVVAVAGTIAVLRWFANWQDQLRNLMGVAGLSLSAYPLMFLIAAVVFVVSIALARMLVSLWRWVGRQLNRVVPARVAAVASGVLIAAVIVTVLNGVAASAIMSLLNDTFKAINQETSADTVAPTVRERSGGPGSLVSWDSLGRQGRIFVAGGPTTEGLATFNQRPARQPIRTYTGLASADTPEEEADLGVAELERAGGFDRAVLGVATTTGTGWINENTAAALEYLHNGDSALVSMQYSYLPSWISFVVDKERAKHAGQALFDAVYAKWQTLPPEHRPKLVVFGESLGSFGGEAAFSGVQDMAVRTDGVLFVGPTNSNVVWRDTTARRDQGTPEWLPIYHNGQTAHFVARPADLDRPAAPWQAPRVVYLQHPSDPITWWTPRLLFEKPDWLREPRGYDVLPSTRWLPIVTFLQVSADMAVSVDVPDGHGHTFHADIADAWAAILQPPNWTAADTVRLRAILTAE
ncbi:alpha/beta hydrolase [Nocardia sp. KC 131]|uniref:alpha/beta hydrolase n=1 Tax=Nocardia arseniciresistens TaxID=3392119 RepID=UPI00398F2758